MYEVVASCGFQGEIENGHQEILDYPFLLWEFAGGRVKDIEEVAC
jgi:hypothetical protein